MSTMPVPDERPTQGCLAGEFEPPPGSGPALAPVASGPAAAESTGPIVVVHYRPRALWSVLLMPVLVLLLACFVLSYRIWAPDWLGVDPLALFRPRPVERQAAKPSEPVESDRVEATPIAAPQAAEPEPVLVARPDPAEPAPEPAVEVRVSDLPAVPPASAMAPERVEPAPVNIEITPAITVAEAASGHEATLAMHEAAPEAAVAAEPAEPADPPAAPARDPKSAMAEIEAEAMALKAERKALEEMKADLLEGETARDRKESFEGRKAYHVELQKALRDVGRVRPEVVAQHIHALTDRSGSPARNARPLQAQLTADVATRQNSIRVLRRRGLPESEILRVLEKGHMRFSITRTGPQTEDEATIRAARDLLAVAVIPSDEIPLPAPGASPATDLRGKPLQFPRSTRRR